MKHNTVSRIIEIVLLILGSLLLLNAIAVALASNFNVGIVMTFLLGAVFLFGGIFLSRIVRCVPKWVWITCLCGILAVVVCASALLLIGRCDNTSYDEDAILVLGAGIHGERVSLTLRNRLDAAIAYHEKNPDSLIVVSGGQGPQEDITEALAMERYLVERGISKDIIIKEELSTSTAENFAFSKVLLDERLGEEYSVAYVTNDFHIFRAGMVARNAGLENIAYAHSNTVWYLVVPCCLRECAAILNYWRLLLF